MGRTTLKIGVPRITSFDSASNNIESPDMVDLLNKVRIICFLISKKSLLLQIARKRTWHILLLLLKRIDIRYVKLTEKNYVNPNCKLITCTVRMFTVYSIQSIRFIIPLFLPPYSHYSSFYSWRYVEILKTRHKYDNEYFITFVV